MKTELLTAEEEIALGLRIENGDERAKTELIERNYRLVWSIAYFYNENYGILSRDDLVQEGRIGLIKAAEGWDCHRGYKFSTYATWWIRLYIVRAIANYCSTIRVPEVMSKNVKKLEIASAKFKYDFGRLPFKKELALAMDVPLDTINSLIAAQRARRLSSLDCLSIKNAQGHFERPVKDIVALDPVEVVVKSKIRSVLLYLMKHSGLSAMEKRILKCRFLLEVPLTLEETGVIIERTMERVRQIQKKALQKIRDCHEDDPKIRALFELDGLEN